MKTPVPLLLVGGFLGAGKTTLLIAFAKYLADRHKKAGIITNDQGEGLVDTVRVAAAGFPAEEITGSCFCCNFPGLLRAAEILVTQMNPDIILAEPVGSCTDLRATIAYPFVNYHSDIYDVAPLTVVVDPHRLMQILAVQSSPDDFCDDVKYIYRKQLEEADVIVVNKGDQLNDERREPLRSLLRDHFSNAKVFEASSVTGTGLAELFEYLLANRLVSREAPEVDYGIYAAGEAKLGWVNSTVRFESYKPFNSEDVLQHLMDELRKNLAQQPEPKIEIAHLKISLQNELPKMLAAISVTRNFATPKMTETMPEKASGACMLTINLRAQGDAEILRNIVEKAVMSHLPGRSIHKSTNAFQPGKPEPSHRPACV